MATAADKVILFDDACPMCRVYTAAFVRVGILTPEGRKGFTSATTCDLSRIDRDRARHEIPLLDTRTGETLYGLDALFTLLASRFPLLSPIFRFHPLRWVLQPLYQFISYNRRMIAGCAPAPLGENGFDSAPDFHRGWRILHLALCAVALPLLVHASLPHTGAMAAVPTMLSAFFLMLQMAGIFLALTLLPRQCGVWDRAGSLATNALTFGILLRLFTALLPVGIAGFATAFLAAATITLLDANRRLRPRCAVPTPVRRGRVQLPMVGETDNTVLRCLHCQGKHDR